MSNKTATPKLRFPEFQDKWRIAKIGDFIESYKGGAPLTPSDFVPHSDYEVIPKKAMSEDMWLKLDTEKPTYCKENFYKENLQSVVDNTYLITTLRDLVPSGPSIGYIVKYAGNKKYILAQGVYGFKPKKTINTDFLIHFSKTGIYRRMMQAVMVGSTQVHIRNSVYFDLPINVPSIPEQQKIADCLTSLDDLIAAQSQKVAALQAYKKGLMQNLFPVEGESVPRLRFPEFESAGGWEEKRLGSFCKIGDIDHKMPSSVADGIPYIMTGDFLGINDFDFDNAKKISVEDYEQLSRKIKPEFGDIIIARYASVGAVRYIETKRKFLVSYSCAIIKCNKSENSKYLYYVFQSDVIQSKIALEINMGSQKNIGIDSIKQLNIFLPALPEQQRIAELLTALDEQISAQGEALAGLKVHKRGLLQGLFP